jgi:hypothetical protein
MRDLAFFVILNLIQDLIFSMTISPSTLRQAQGERGGESPQTFGSIAVEEE